jgi:hypothetical protein
MDSNTETELVHCPNCKEDVPKTLYCLNCGYPLYKNDEENKAEPDESESDVTEKVQEIEDLDEGDTEIEESESIEKGEEEEAKPEEPEIKIEEPHDLMLEGENKDNEPESVVKDIEIIESNEEIEEQEIESIAENGNSKEQLESETPKPEIKIEETEIDNEVTEQEAEEPVMEEEQKEDEVEEPIIDSIEPEPKDEEEINLMEDIILEFAPDPLTKEVMNNLAKNITLKIRLIRLLRDGQVKEETFKKLFDSYIEQGRIWMNRREEILRRFKTDTDLMEQKLMTARKDYELLEIRKSIGDTDEAEYSVKAPAYKWDIEHLEKEIKNRRSGTVYVDGLRKLVPEEEILELESYNAQNYSRIEHIEDVKSETIEEIKESLQETYNILSSI